MAEIKLTNANAIDNFISFSVDGLNDQIQVGITSDTNSHGQALSIAYKGEVTLVPFTAALKDIEDINKGIPSQVEVDLYVKEQLNKFNTQNGVK